MGDSQTDYTSPFGVSAADNWSKQLSVLLNNSGAITKSRAFGIGGETVAEFLGRLDVMFMYDKPALAIVFGGINDIAGTHTGTAQTGTTNTISLATSLGFKLNAFIGNIITITGGTGSGQTNTIIAYQPVGRVATVLNNWSTIPDATSTYSVAQSTQANLQANTQAVIKGLKYGVTGVGAGLGQGCSFYSQTMLPANGYLGQRFVIMNDTSTTGGVAANQSGQHATISGNFSSAPQQTVWEWRNSQAGELGWGRVAITGTAPFAEGVSKIIVTTQSYLNWSTGGDSYNVTTSTGTPYANYVPVRAAITAAASTESVVLCDLYYYQSTLIYGGVFLGATVVSETTQSSFSWEWQDMTPHHNKYGHEILARALYAVIINQGWLPDLSA